MITTISFIGSGNVATHLASAFYSVGLFHRNHKLNINQVYSRKIAHATTLANLVEATPIDNLDQLKPVDLVLLCVPDDAILTILNQLEQYDGLIAHTSGITGLEHLRKQLGYFYPLQSFRKNQATDLSQTPIFIDAKKEQDKQNLLHLAQQISQNSKILHQKQKEKLHLAAVFVNNYVNHLFGLTHSFLSQNQLSFTDLQPIIKTTIERALEQNPFDIQTGPALRKDDITLQQHFTLLNQYPEMQKVYQQLANSIQAIHHEHHHQ